MVFFLLFILVQMISQRWLGVHSGMAFLELGKGTRFVEFAQNPKHLIDA